MSYGYAVAYRLGITPWERAGEGGRASFEALLDRVERHHGPGLGRALDLGCGRGANTHELAARGWEAVGLDNISTALETARQKDGAATFVLGDVTRLEERELGTFDFFLDVGCFHGLTPAQRRAEADGVTRLANAGATLLLLAFQPHRLPMLPGGVTEAQITGDFARWTMVHTEAADTSGMPKPLRQAEPRWYWLSLRD